MRWSRTLTVVNCHAEGEVGNVVTGGVFDVPGATMFDKMMHLEEVRDDLRRICIFEPRGSANQSVNFLLPPTDPRAQMGYVIAESTEYPAMSGSNTICVATVLLETGILPMTEPVTELVLEAPAGLIHVRCRCENGKVTQVEFTNQPAFANHLDKTIEVEGVGTLTVDVGYGGMTYVIVDAQKLGFAITPDEARQLCELGQTIKAAAAEQLPSPHPLNPNIKGITQTEFVMPLRRENGVLTSRNTVIVSPGRCDRSPCGTGTSARLAVMHAKGLIEAGERFVHESIIGSRFESRIDSLTQLGDVPAVVPVVAGQAWISAISQVGVDPTDRYQTGFTLSDTWLEAVDDKLIKSRAKP
ncbi:MULTISPECIES: proline racemase family protein [unclassified Caballeronia]|uniref:proline racemase family protein n=1 Tax=unclassified Caballeronia TaxID=2646786 RepID=UPI001FD16B61|nr:MULTISPECIES: proline racemase family protein [unclassified Caballeronia]MDR5773802.1 proline racemase family protein [Caballeronia sp. LZ002]MDR5799419.1 proline racemase family protein [Caballeronia sp. LZ001]MDR5849237.1 proline racemase family protein [Caballeronia sp. LZ003]